MQQLPCPSYWADWSYLVARRVRKAAQGMSVGQEVVQGIEQVGMAVGQTASTWEMHYMVVQMDQEAQEEPVEQEAQAVSV